MLTHDPSSRHAATVKWRTEESSRGRLAENKEARETDPVPHLILALPNCALLN